MADNPMTTSGIGGAAPPGPPMSSDFSFADNPPGSVTDSQYMADEADLRQQINQQYQELLSQMGYMDPVSGAFIPGSVEQSADIQEGNLKQQMGQADLQVDQNAQNSGILFSGVRGTQRAEAEMPYMQQVGQLGFDTTNTLSGLYRQAQGLMGDYNTQNMKLLAAAADRAAANAIANPVSPPRPVDIPVPPSVTPEPPPPPSADMGTEPVPYRSGTMPAVAYAKGGEVEEPTNAVLGENARPGDPRSHEVVIPRNKLSKEGNAMLDHLMGMAGIRHAAMSRLGIGHHDLNLDAPMLRGLGADNAAASLWVHRHPYAVAHGAIPHWVTADETHMIHGGEPVASLGHMVPHGQMIPDTGEGVYPIEGLPPMPLAGGPHLPHLPIHHLAHHIGMAALRRISQGLTPPQLPPPEAVAGHFGPGVVGIPSDDYNVPPIDVSHPFRAPGSTPIPVAPIQPPVGGPRME